MTYTKHWRVLFMGNVPFGFNYGHYSAGPFHKIIVRLFRVLFVGRTHRFIFLFRWTEERRARRKVIETAAEIFVKDEEKVNNIFFAQQVGRFDRLPQPLRARLFPALHSPLCIPCSAEQLCDACTIVCAVELC